MKNVYEVGGVLGENYNYYTYNASEMQKLVPFHLNHLTNSQVQYICNTKIV